MTCSRVNKEEGIYGQQWDYLHGGYFSDPAVAMPFIRAIGTVIERSNPEIIVDLGGGTGFVLHELAKQHIPSEIRLVNLDISQKQLDCIPGDRICRIHRSITEFRRSDIDPGDKRLLFVMRSALHYFSRKGLIPLLSYLRSQMNKGEIFIHQTACFDSALDSRCLNRLYTLMETGKWYPTIKHFSTCLEKTGWRLQSITPAAALPLTSRDLKKRYGLSGKRIGEIRNELEKSFSEKENILKFTPRGFCAYLHYKIFTCIAV